MFKKIMILAVCISLLICNLSYCATFDEISPYIGKYVIIHINMGMWKQESYIGKIIDLYEVRNDFGKDSVITIITIDKKVETIRIDFIDRIKEYNIFEM